MLTLTLVVILLCVEIVVIFLMLLPYVNKFSTPLVSKALTKLSIPTKVVFVLLVYAVCDSFLDMRRKNDDAHASDPSVGPGYVVVMQQKFRAERNFYLNSFTITLFIILLRLIPLLTDYNELKVKVASNGVTPAKSEASASVEKKTN